MDEKITAIPLQLKGLLVQYFDKMQEFNKIKEYDSNAMATAFISMNFGYLVSMVAHDHDFGVDEEIFMKQMIHIFSVTLDF